MENLTEICLLDSRYKKCLELGFKNESKIRISEQDKDELKMCLDYTNSDIFLEKCYERDHDISENKNKFN